MCFEFRVLTRNPNLATRNNSRTKQIKIYKRCQNHNLLIRQ